MSFKWRNGNKIKAKPETRKAYGNFLVLVIMIIIFLVSIYLLPTKIMFSNAELKTKANMSSKYPSPSVSQFWTNNSLANALTLTGSPLSIVKTMRNLNETVPQPGEKPYIVENNSYVFSQNKTEISTPNNNSHTGEFGKGAKIAVVMPTFTSAAYNNAFYVFYNKYINITRGVDVNTDLNLLSSKVTNEPSLSASAPAMLYLEI